MDIFHVDDVHEAVRLAERMRREGRYDWFRGQTANRPVLSNLCRLDEARANAERERSLRFAAWVKSTPELAELGTDDDAIIAVAQHHGLRTNFVDFTTDPRIAGFFAVDGREASGATHGVILLLDTADLMAFWSRLPPEYPAPKPLRPQVKNLWRLEAQRGVFLECPLAGTGLEGFYSLDRIMFPHKDVPPPLERHLVYPTRRSPLEEMMARFFMDEGLRETGRVLRAIPSVTFIRVEAPGEFGDPKLLRDGRPPPPHPSWDPALLAPWLPVREERLSDVRADIDLIVPAGEDISFADIRARVRAEVLALLGREPRARAAAVTFRVGPGEPIEPLGRLWDVLRRLPYEDAEVAEGMGNAAALLAERANADRSGRHRGDDQIEAVLGECVQLNLVAPGGGYSRAFVATDRLMEAVRGDIAEHLDPARKDHLLAHPSRLLDAVFAPDRLFEFRRLATLFATQAVPTQIFLRRPVVYGSPAGLSTVSRP